MSENAIWEKVKIDIINFYLQRKEGNDVNDMAIPVVFDPHLLSYKSHTILGVDANVGHVIVFVPLSIKLKSNNKHKRSPSQQSNNSTEEKNDSKLKATIFTKYGISELYINNVMSESLEIEDMASKSIIKEFLSLYRTPFGTTFGPDLQTIKEKKPIYSLIRELAALWAPSKYLVGIVSGNKEKNEEFSFFDNQISKNFKNLMTELGEKTTTNIFIGSKSENIISTHKGLSFACLSNYSKKEGVKLMQDREIMVVLYSCENASIAYDLGSDLQTEMNKEKIKPDIIIVVVKNNAYYCARTYCRIGVPGFPPTATDEFTKVQELAMFLKAKCVYGMHALMRSYDTFSELSKQTEKKIINFTVSPQSRGSISSWNSTNSFVSDGIPENVGGRSESDSDASSKLDSSVEGGTVTGKTNKKKTRKSSKLGEKKANQKTIKLESRKSFIEKLEDNWFGCTNIDKTSEKFLSMTDTEMKRQEVMYEIIKTERSYVNDLALVVEIIDEIAERKILTQLKINRFFGDFGSIKKINESFLNDMRTRQEEENYILSRIDDFFINHLPMMKKYVSFVSGQEEGRGEYEKESTNNLVFRSFLEEKERDPRCRRLDLQCFLLAPLQRLTRYPLLLKELIKSTPEDNEDYQSLNEIKIKIEEIVTQTNHMKKRVDDLQRLIDLSEKINWNGHQHESLPSLNRKVLIEGDLTYFKDYNTKTQMKSWKKSGQRIHAILLTDMLLLLLESKNKYTLIAPVINLDMILIRDFDLDGVVDFHLFEIVHVGNDLHFVATETKEEKVKWVTTIEKESKFKVDSEKISRSASVSKKDELNDNDANVFRSGSNTMSNRFFGVQRKTSDKYRQSDLSLPAPSLSSMSKAQSSKDIQGISLGTANSSARRRMSLSKDPYIGMSISENENEIMLSDKNPQKTVSESQHTADTLQGTNEDPLYEDANDLSNTAEEEDFRMNFNIPHKFSKQSLLKPQPCMVCEKMIRFNNSAMKCSGCGLYVHSTCEGDAQPLCGISKGMAITLQGLSSAKKKNPT